MQIPILSGIYTDNSADFRIKYPRNLIPIIEQQGISDGYLRPADGIVHYKTGAGFDRGGINWNGVHYRVMGTKLIKITEFGVYVVIGDVGGSGQVTMTYSFDYLAIASNNKLYLYDGTTLSQVTDTDLGNVLDIIWIDGYFMTTDGEFLVVTELTDPFSVNPLKYGSSEANPDPINGILRYKNEVYAFNRYTIEVFDNVGGTGFPFERIESAMIEKGSIGTYTKCLYMDNVAFMGGGFNEAIGVYVGANSQVQKISSREIDILLWNYTETELSNAVMETKTHKDQELLYIHLKDRTIVFNGTASRKVGKLVWYQLNSGLNETDIYRARNFVRVYDKWYCGNPADNKVGYLDYTISSHYGQTVGWEFGTSILYNEAKSAIFHELQLIALTGRTALGVDPTVWTSYSTDGVTWSTEKPRRAGKIGDRNKRLTWFQQGFMRNFRIQRFRGDSDAFISFAKLEARLEALNG